MPKSFGRRCVNNPNSFCYVCGEFTTSGNKKPICEFIKLTYMECFGFPIEDQNKTWVPHIICNSCYSSFRMCKNGNRSRFRFDTPMIWREPRNHHDDCYFCMVNLKGANRKKRRGLKYPNLDSARRPISHSQNKTLTPTKRIVKSTGSQSPDKASTSSEFFLSNDYESICDHQLFNQSELNDLVRDLNLSKNSAEILASRLKEKNLLSPGTLVSFYRQREKALLPFFSEDKNLVFCNNIQGLMMEMGIEEYDPNQWRLFIDKSKRSLKCVLLHNTNKFGSLPVAYSTSMKEEYDSVSLLLKVINYADHQWVICVDLKMVNILLGFQCGYTKHPCFICLWDSRAKNDHWTKKNWLLRDTLEEGKHNVIKKPLVPREKIILPPLHIKLGLMKQYVKALDKDGECFRFLSAKFRGLSSEKLKQGIFDGPMIRDLINDAQFVTTMTNDESRAWTSFVLVVKKFLGKNKAENYEQLVNNMLMNFQKLGCSMNTKMHYLFSHLDQFTYNLGDFSEEEGERFHQDIRIMEERYQGRWDSHMMADYCWSLQRDMPGVIHSRKSLKKSFFPTASATDKE